MIKVIPEKKIFICDVCGKEGNRPAHSPEFIKKQDALDYSGYPVADGSYKIQPCISCDSALEKAIKETIKTIKTAS